MDLKDQSTHKAAARLSRPYEDQSPLWEAVVHSQVPPTPAIIEERSEDENTDSDAEETDDEELHDVRRGREEEDIAELEGPFGDLRIPPNIQELESMPSPNPMGSMGSPMDDEFRGDRTPKTWKDGFDGDGIPDGPISEWDEHEVAEWISSLGLGKYHDDMISE